METGWGVRAQGLPYGMLVSQVACLPLGKMLPLFNCFPALCVPHLHPSFCSIFSRSACHGAFPFPD